MKVFTQVMYKKSWRVRKCRSSSLRTFQSQSYYLGVPSAELFSPEDSVLFCLPINETLITAGAIIGGAFVVVQAVCITLSVLGIRHLKRNSNGFSAKTRAMHLQLTRLLLAQVRYSL